MADSPIQIAKLPIQRMHVAELFSFMKNYDINLLKYFCETVKKTITDDNGVTKTVEVVEITEPFVKEYDDAFVAWENARRFSSKNSNLPNKTDANDIIASGFRGFKSMMRSASYSRIEAKKAAGEALAIELDGIGDIANEAYKNKLGDIVILLKVCDSLPQSQKDLLGIEEYIEDIRDGYELYTKASSDVTVETSNTIGNETSARKYCCKVYEKSISIINARILETNDPKLIALAKEVNQNVLEAKAVVLSRQTRLKNLRLQRKAEAEARKNNENNLNTNTDSDL